MLSQEILDHPHGNTSFQIGGKLFVSFYKNENAIIRRQKQIAPNNERDRFWCIFPGNFLTFFIRSAVI
jgi:hypothetical protein